MTGDESACALFRGPLPEGFSRRVFWLGPGAEVGVEPETLPEAIVLVERGALELECPSGARWRFESGSMIPIGALPVVRLRSVGDGPLVLVAVSRSDR
jgi:hypothetical protein